MYSYFTTFLAILLAVCTLRADPANTLYPEGDIFPIGGYSGQPERDKAAGFTLAGPVYRHHNEFLAECERVGLPFIYTIGVELDFLGKQGDPIKEIDLDAIRQEIREKVEAVKDSPAIAIWYLTPEELRFWKPLEMQYLQAAYETIKATDPYNRPVWMYEPGHRNAAALGHTIKWQDICGKGMYVNYASRMNERVWTRWTMEQENQAIAEVNPNAMAIAVTEMFRQPPEEHVADIPAWVRHDTYSSLMNGAKSIVIFSLSKRKGLYAWQDYYDAWASVARELNDPEHPVGTIFLRGEEQALPALQITSGPETVTLVARRASNKEDIIYPSLQAKRFVWKGKDYLFLLNSTLEVLEVDLNDEGWYDFEGTPHRTITLPAWGAAALYKR